MLISRLSSCLKISTDSQSLIWEQAYDAYVSGSGNVIAGPSAPLYHTCSDPKNRVSVSSAIDTWINSGFNPQKVLLGLPFYGYGYTVLDGSLKPTQFSTTNETSLLFQAVSPAPQGGPSAGGGGQWLYHELHHENKVSQDYTTGTSGYQRHYDDCTHTVSTSTCVKWLRGSTDWLTTLWLQPLLYHPDTKHLIVYDDAGSILEKTRLAEQYKLAGVNVFDTTGDTPEFQLAQAIHLTYPVDHSDPSNIAASNPQQTSNTTSNVAENTTASTTSNTAANTTENDTTSTSTENTATASTEPPQQTPKLRRRSRA